MKQHHHGAIDPHHHMKEGHKDMQKHMGHEGHQKLTVHHHTHMKEPHGHSIHAMGAQEGGVGETEMAPSRSPHHEHHTHYMGKHSN